MRKPVLVLLLVLALTLGSATAQTIPYNGGNILENFDGLGSAGTNTPTGWFVGWAGTSVTFTTNIVVNIGSIAPNQNAGWNFGTAGATDRALGLMATSSGTPAPPANDRFIELRIQNLTAQPISAIHVRYDGEEWRTGSSSTQANTNVLQFSADGANFTNMGSIFQFVQPVFTPTSSALDGNATVNRRTNIGGAYSLPTAVPPSGVIYLRWYDLNDASTDPALAMDNFSFFVPTNAPIVITNQPQTQAVLPGTNVALAVTAGPAITSYQWQKDGVDLTNNSRVAGATAAKLNISNVQPADLGIYRVLLSSTDDSVWSDPATILFVPPPFHWVQQAGAPGSTADFGDGIAMDGATALYVTGSYVSGATFAGTVLLGSGLFLARYTAGGVLAWVRTATSVTGTSVGHNLAVDPLGNCYVTGSFDTTTTFGATNISSAGGSDVFLAKYDRSGALLWVTRQGGAFDDSGRGVAADGTNGCFVTGLLQSSSSAASRDIFLAKYSANGLLQWQRQPASTSSDAGMAAASDEKGNGYITGWFTGTANFISTNVTALGSRDIFVAKYNNAGTLLWVATMGGAGGDEGKGVGVDTNGNVYVTGSFNIGGGNTSNDAEKLLLTKLSSAGTLLWQRELLASFDYFDFSSATDRSGNTWVVGGVRGSGTLNGVPVTSTGSYDAVIAKYDAAGTLIWISQVSGAGSAILHRVAPDSAGRCYLTGEFDGGATFGNTNLTSAGGTDILVARLGSEIPEPVRLAASRSSNLAAIDIFGAPGSLLRLEATTLLTNGGWQTLTNLILPTNTIRAVEADSTNFVQRFYRALAVP